MKKIEKLTPEQEAAMPSVRDEWIAIGLDTSPLVEARARAAVRLMYQCGGVPPPKEIRFFAGPTAMLRAVAAEDEHRHPPSHYLGQCVYGQHDAGWLAFCSFFREKCGLVDETEKLRGLLAVAGECGWVFPGTEIAFVAAKPEVILRDLRGRLHATDRPALRYGDGTVVYSIHGVRVSADIIEHPETLTAERIRSENNAEVRRALMGVFGEDRFLREIGATALAEDEFGALWEIRWPEERREPTRMVRVINSTPEPDGSSKVYFLQVPPTTKTPHDGVAWSFGLDAETYSPEVET